MTSTWESQGNHTAVSFPSFRKKKNPPHHFNQLKENSYRPGETSQRLERMCLARASWPEHWFLGWGKKIPDKIAKADVTEDNRSEKKKQHGVKYQRSSQIKNMFRNNAIATLCTCQHIWDRDQ